MLPISKTYQVLPHLYGGRQLAQVSKYDYRAQSLADTYRETEWYKRHVANSAFDQSGLPTQPDVLNTNTERTDGGTDYPQAQYFSRLFALRGKVYGILAPFEATRARTDESGTMVDDEHTRIAEFVPSVDTSVTVKFTFVAPLPTLQPSERVRILGKTYTVARLEYSIPVQGSPTLVGYFYPTKTTNIETTQVETRGTFDFMFSKAFQ